MFGSGVGPGVGFSEVMAGRSTAVTSTDVGSGSAWEIAALLPAGDALANVSLVLLFGHG
jgi:hypothetical protein